VTPLGFGSAALGNLYAAVDDEVATATVETALQLGVRLFDTAPYYGYGLSEKRLGAALAASGASDIVVSTKVGRLLVPRQGEPRSDQGFVNALCFDPVFDYSHDGVMRSVEASLDRLGRDRIDVLLIHDIGTQTHGDDRHAEVFESAMEGGYRALEKLRRAGQIGAIGLGVNECAVCIEAMERGDFDCFLLAGRYTLLEQGAMRALLPACEKRGISIIVGGPYNSGILVEGSDAAANYDYRPAPPDVRERVARIAAVCRSHGVPLPAAALQFPLRHPTVACVIPGARTPLEVRAGVGWFEHRISDSLWSDLISEGLLDPEVALATPAPGATA
jgi:D-threo-aldose 1-dehydrogenase